jgi:hypothetical protein
VKHASPQKAERAAAAAFVAAEKKLEALEKFHWGPAPANQRKFDAYARRGIKRLGDLLAAADDGYCAVRRHGLPTWDLAARARSARAKELFFATLPRAPLPPEIEKAGPEHVAAYQDAMGGSEPSWEAADEYRGVVEDAARLGIDTAWTRFAAERLAALQAGASGSK